MLVSNKTARMVGGASAVGIAVQNALPASGESFSVPPFDQNGIMTVYLPLAVGVVALFPNVVSGSRMISAVGLTAIGAKRILLDGQTSFSTDNILQGYLPLVTGALLLLP